MKLTDSQKDRIIIKRLKHDLKNVEDSLEDIDRHATYSEKFAMSLTKQHKKNIKMLKRAINFYSVEEPYDEV